MGSGAADYAVVAGVSRTCSLLDCGDVFCFGNVCTVAGKKWMAVAENARSVRHGEAEEIRVKNGVEKV